MTKQTSPTAKTGEMDMESVLAFLESNGLNDAANLARSRAQSTGRLSSSAEKARFVFVSAGQAPQI